MATSPGAREKAESLTRTWDYLDQLPTVKASDVFAQETLTVTTQCRPQPISSFRFGWDGLLIWIVGLTASTVGGFLVTHGLEASNDTKPQQPQEDYIMIQNLDAYTSAGSIESLEELQRSDLFDNQGKADGKPITNK